MAQTRNDLDPDSFNLRTTTNPGKTGVGMAACMNEFVGIGGDIFCGDLLAETDNEETAGVITCNYTYCKVGNSRKSWLGAPPLKFGLFEKHTKFEKIFLMVWMFTK